MRGKRGWAERPAAGFTLLELIVVLFLAGLMAALVAPRFDAPLETARLRAGAAQLCATLSKARLLAAADARERSVLLDPENGGYRIAGEEGLRPLPEGIRFERVRVAGAERPRSPAVRFFPDGSGEEAEIALASAGGGRLRVLVEPLTGIAEVGP